MDKTELIVNVPLARAWVMLHQRLYTLFLNHWWESWNPTAHHLVAPTITCQGLRVLFPPLKHYNVDYLTTLYNCFLKGLAKLSAMYATYVYTHCIQIRCYWFAAILNPFLHPLSSPLFKALLMTAINRENILKAFNWANRAWVGCVLLKGKGQG